MNYRLQNAKKTSGFTINAHQKCLKFDDKTPKNALKFMQKMRQIFSELSVWRFRPKFYLKKPCVSLFVVGVLRCGLKFNIKKNFVFFVAFLGIFTSALQADYTGIIKPSSITLAGGVTQTHNAIADCNRYDCTFGYQNDKGVDFTYATSGSGKSSLTLNAILPQNPPSTAEKTIKFYMNNTTIKPNSNLTLNNFNSILLERTMSIDNATLIFNANTSSTSSIFQMNSGSRVLLTNGATLEVNARQFLNREVVSVSKSTLNITATTATRSYNTIQNDGGSITINGNFYNLGQKVVNYSTTSSVANFTSTDGQITINGNFYNGGQLPESLLVTSGDCRVGGCGGGNIIIDGGLMSVSGQLISQGKDGQNSSIQIKGGTLKVTGGLYNKDGSTLTFGVRNGIMGQLQGNLTNQNGVVKVDLKGISTAGTHQIITGTITGLTNVDITNTPNPAFLTSTYKDGSVSITQAGGGSGGESGGGSGGGSPSKFDEFKSSLNKNEQGIVSVLSSKFGGDLPLLTNVENIETALADADKSVKDNLVSQPKNMLTAFKGDVLLAPMSQGRFVARRLAASGAVRFDNGRRVRALQAKPNVEFQLAPVGGVMKSADANGVLAGLSLGANYKMGAFTHKTSLAYAYGTAKQDLSTQSTETKAHLLQAGVLSLYKYGIYETEFNANLLFGSFTIDNKWTERSLNSSSKFNNYELNLGLVAGARYGKKLSFKPFVGVQNYGQRQDGFVGILGFESKAYNAYILDGVLGVQMQYVRSAFSSVYGKVSFERRLYNTHKFVFLRSGDNELKYENQSYESVVSAALGAQLLTYKRFKLNAEGFLRHYDTGLNYYGGSLVMRYSF